MSDGFTRTEMSTSESAGTISRIGLPGCATPPTVATSTRLTTPSTGAVMSRRFT